MGKCSVCNAQGVEISGNLGVCLACIRQRPEEALAVVREVRRRSREAFGLEPSPPRDEGGLFCGLCANMCKIGRGKRGFCGLVFNINGRLVRYGGTPDAGVLEWYYDPLPTNCVAWWFCAGCTGAGYPKYAYSSRGPELGYYNLAVFYGACSYDCLYCQNWHYRHNAAKIEPVMSAESLAARADKKVSCVCYFGGDPSPQMPHAIKTSELAMERARKEGRIMRICWETNGYMLKKFAERAAELSLESGGNVKFDLKTSDDCLNKALCGVSNEPTLENFEMIGTRFFEARPELPILTASTLLVPGYVNAEEVGRIAEFIASIDPRIPYTLLAFHPQYVMNDLPTTRRKHAMECLETAREAGLEQVRIGNVHLLS